VRLWDLRTAVCQAVLTTPAHPVAVFDQQGLVFAVGTDGGVIKLFDAAQYAKGPFETFVVRVLLLLAFFTFLGVCFLGGRGGGALCLVSAALAEQHCF